jgi:type IV secretion system protein VirD4
MTRAPSAAGSHSVGKYLGAALIAATAGLYLSGYGFLRWIKRPAATEEPLAPLLAPIQYGYWYGDVPEVRRKLLCSLGGGMGLAFVGTGLLLIPKKRPQHGDARFAFRKEIKAAGWLGEDGIILGVLRSVFGDRYLMLPGQQGVEIVEPPRSGKGVSFVIPNLLNFRGSVVVNDIKKELGEETAGYRAACGHAVFFFDPFGERTHRWNPLTYVSDVPYRRIDDLQRISWLRYPNPKSGDPFWAAGARVQFLGTSLYVFETPGLPRTMGEVLRQGMGSSGEGFKRHWTRLIERAKETGHPLDPITVMLLQDTADLAPQTISSIRKQFVAGLELWLNPLVDAATSESDFDLRELRTGTGPDKRPMAIYCCSVPDDQKRLEPVRNLFFQQVFGLNTRELPKHNPALIHQVFLPLDEVTSLGYVPALLENAAFLPGYGLRLGCVAQADSQIIDLYGVQGAATLKKTLGARIYFAPESGDDAEALSKELHTYTVKLKSRSQPGLFGNGKSSVTVSEQPRRLMLAEELRYMGEDRVILLRGNLRPVFAWKVRYHSDPVFMRRLLPPPEIPRLDIEAAIARIRRIEKEPEPMHTVTAADVPTLGQKKLTDFAGDFDAIAVPAGQLSDAQVHGVVDGFLATLAA